MMAPIPAATQPLTRLLSCEGPLRPDASAVGLAKYFGARNIRNADIYIGEGNSEPGTIVFDTSPLDRIEVLWIDPEARTRPRAVTVRGSTLSPPASHWHTRRGLALGIRLRELERMNRRPFRLLGFGWDYGGTTMSWAGGTFDAEQPAPCRTRARLETGGLLTEERQRWDRQVAGDIEFSSGHLAMQALDPYVYEIWLDYQPVR